MTTPSNSRSSCSGAVFEEIPRPPISVQYTPTKRGRRGEVVLRNGPQTFVGRLDIKDQRDRARLLRHIQKTWPDLNKQALERASAELDRIATTLASGNSDTNHSVEPNPDPYFVNESGMYWRKQTRDGEEIVRLANFVARISCEVVVDDGVTQECEFEIEIRLGGVDRVITVMAPDFTRLNWVIERLGATAILEPGNSIKERTRAAIQTLSGDPPRTQVFTHTGWRRIGNQEVYLHAGGAIGSDDPVALRLDDPLDRFLLPRAPEGQELLLAARASLRFLDVAPREVSAPCFAATWRAPLGSPCDFSMYFLGPTGVQKTEVAALAQQHFGRSMDRLNLPGTWMSTANFSETTLFHAKDTLFVIDDFAPNGNADQLNRTAERILRGQGNRAGRGRLTQSGSRVPEKASRSLVLVTGEDLPRGHSIRARCVIVELSKGCVDLKVLTQAQADAANGLYAAAMSAYLTWLAPRRRTIESTLLKSIEVVRRQLRGLAHGRGPDQVAQLQLGADCFLRFAVETSAIDVDEATQIRSEVWSALISTARRQGDHQMTEDPVVKFVDYLNSLVNTGKAHLAHLAHPLDAASRDQAAPCIGWRDSHSIYLDFTATLSAIQTLGKSVDGPLDVSASTLKKRLYEAGALESIDDGGASGKRRFEIRRHIGKDRRRVLHISADLAALREKVGRVGQVGQEHTPSPPPWPTFDIPDPGVGHRVGREHQPDNIPAENRPLDIGDGVNNG